MPIYLTKRWGESFADPQDDDLVGALGELSVDHPEHPDCWVENEDGWVISAFRSGLVVLEGPTRDCGVSHMHAIPRAEILRLWKLLRVGRLDDIRRSPWVLGRLQLA